jgi:hypothetical protein
MIVLLPHLLLNRKAGRKPLVDGPGLMQQQNLPYLTVHYGVRRVHGTWPSMENLPRY